MRLSASVVLIILTVISRSSCEAAAARSVDDQYRYVDDYHYLMVADSVRNEVYYSALQKAVKRNESVVLDAGAGTMLLSMMALDLGAKRVLGVESNPLMCSIAREVLLLNNYSSPSIALYEGAFETLRLGHNLVRMRSTYL